MTTAADLCGRGFLPRELPPPFSSLSFGALAGTAWQPRVTQSSCVLHNLFRSGVLRRQLSIPNPLAFLALAREIEARWNQLQPILGLSPWSLSRPVIAVGRAVEPRQQLKVTLLARVKNRAGKRYAVKADILRFYPSIYTHALEWAIHTKLAVKANRALPHAQRQQFWGSGLDDRHRGLQERQSIGIPVGPDTSLIAAEVLLARVDEIIAQQVQCDGLRYVDDYELCFRTLAEAENAMAVLQQVLADFRLDLNSDKTEILDLPCALEPTWTRALRRVSVPSVGTGQRFAMIDLFDAAFEFRNEHPDKHILRFAMGIVRHVTALATNWEILQSLLLQGMVIEPGIIREVLSELVRYRALGFQLNLNKIAETLAHIITRHAPLAHGSEVAWALWSHIQLGIPLDGAELDAVELMDDSVVALVALDAAQRGLTPRPPVSAVWNNMMTAAGLLEGGWLLAYEAAVKGWLPAAHLAQDVDFAAMQNANVEFYRILPVPAQAPINLVGPGGGGGDGGDWSV